MPIEKADVWERKPKFSASAEVTIKVPQQADHVVSFIYEGDVPESFMDEAQQLLGDGNARVAVSVDMSIKDFGTGASASVSVSLSCNQDLGTIERAQTLAGDLARGFAQEQRARAEMELTAIIEQRRNSGQGPNWR